MIASKAGETPRTAAEEFEAYTGVDSVMRKVVVSVVSGVFARTLERDLQKAEARAAEAEQSEKAIRELMNRYNLGGWTDAEAAIKRAIAAEARAAEAEHERDEARKAGMSALLGNVDIRFCAHCGWTTEGRGTLEELQAHVESCERHPLHAALKRASAAELDAGRLDWLDNNTSFLQLKAIYPPLTAEGRPIYVRDVIDMAIALRRSAP